MPLRGCSSGLLATALVIFLLVPVQYYVPDLYLEPKDALLTDTQLNRATPASTDHYHWIQLEHLPPFDLFLTISLLVLALVTHLCDWIQRKLMERRIVKVHLIICIEAGLYLYSLYSYLYLHRIVSSILLMSVRNVCSAILLSTDNRQQWFVIRLIWDMIILLVLEKL